MARPETSIPAAGTDVKMTSEVLRKLEAKDLIVRTVDPANTRARRLRVTERGGELAVRAVAAVETVDAAFFRATPDRAALIGMLRPLAVSRGARPYPAVPDLVRATLIAPTWTASRTHMTSGTMKAREGGWRSAAPLWNDIHGSSWSRLRHRCFIVVAAPGVGAGEGGRI